MGATARALGGAFACALIATSIAACGSSSSATPTGSYATTITGEERLADGKWTITFGKNGSYNVTKGRLTGLTIGPGSHVSGTTLTINPESPEACGAPPSTGTYTMKLTGSQLQLIRINDPCKTRSLILTRTFTKVG